MSQRRPTDLKDKFDSRDLGTHDVKPEKVINPVHQEFYHTVPNLTVFQLLEVVQILLKDFQSKHIPGDDPWYQWFPNAWIDMEKGDKVKNLDTGEIYIVEELIKTNKSRQENYVRFRTGRIPPKDVDILRLDHSKSKMINFVPAYPDTEVKPYEFTADGYKQSDDDTTISTWIDTITYSIIKEEPASMSGKMFQGSSLDMKPRYIETAETEDGFIEVYNQKLDALVRFDFWTLENKKAEELRIWFRNFYNLYGWLIEANGAERFLWFGNYTAKGATRLNPSVVHRSSEFGFRTATSITKNLYTIRQVDLNIKVPRNINGSTKSFRDLISLRIEDDFSETIL